MDIRLILENLLDMVHSPKNVVIKALLKNDKYNEKVKGEVEALINEYKISQTLYDLCFKKQ